ncbi:uncharacterized protein LOC121629094 [Melanotaenia boesemani]|uniref:uncharacterized protein LOC121629094 n=1 Tax=Melanotaenia boesemani TaxID=1250792 RepID=UPI001C0501DA|nr:uncharacterized protein LOC121629094 [Melanotaenia boesemani]XP_041824551.1 uncharacterized protein LOC121629094 [Melanotaenia boesemani]
MGNCCCRPESPCGSTEERNGLLQDDSKATCTGEAVVVGACGPERDDDMRRAEKMAEVAQSSENGEAEPSNTQGNGPLQRGSIHAAAPSPNKPSELKENSIQPQNKERKDISGDNGLTEHLKCTLNSSADSELVASTAEPAEEDRASNSTENSTAHNGAEEECATYAISTVAKPSGELTQNNEALSVPNTQLAAAAGQEASISAVSQETNTQAMSCTLSVDSDHRGSPLCRHDGSEGLNSHDVSQSSSGLEPTGLDHSVQKQDSASSVGEPEATDSADADNSLKSDQDANPDTEHSSPASLHEVTSLEKVKQDAVEETMQELQTEDVPKAEQDDGLKKEENVEGAPTKSETPQAEKDAKIQEVIGKQDQMAGSTDATADAEPASEEEEDDLGDSEEDLYRGAEELSASQSLKVEDRCSLSPAVDILFYSEREWKGNTAKSALIKKGYKEMSKSFSSVRRVRGDNYCALRATLFQVLSQSIQLPGWLQKDDITMLPEQLEAQEGLMSQWGFPGDGAGDATQQLKGYMELLRNTWQAAADCSSAAEQQQLCEQVFQGGEEELGLLEALKLLMLDRAVELHSRMQGGGDVPLFCWLLFARDSSDCPRSFLSNHLRHVGLSAGLEQVEMFLLGYALQCTIQVYRLYKVDTEEFVTYYPDDHKDEWQSVCLVTEDDRHYNVPVMEAAEPQKMLTSS